MRACDVSHNVTESWRFAYFSFNSLEFYTHNIDHNLCMQWGYVTSLRSWRVLYAKESFLSFRGGAAMSDVSRAAIPFTAPLLKIRENNPASYAAG